MQQNLTSDDIIHSYQTYPLVDFFSKNRSLNGCNISFAESRVEDCLESNFRYVDYQTNISTPILRLLMSAGSLCAQQGRSVS